MPTLYISDKYKWSYNNFDARRYDFYEFVDVTRFGSELKYYRLISKGVLKFRQKQNKLAEMARNYKQENDPIRN